MGHASVMIFYVHMMATFAAVSVGASWVHSGYAGKKLLMDRLGNKIISLWYNQSTHVITRYFIMNST